MSKEKIMASIITALADVSPGKDLSSKPSEIIRRELEKITPRTRKEWIRQFREELEAISGELYYCSTPEEMAEVILGILHHRGQDKILISHGKICLKIGHRLTGLDKNLQVLDFSTLDPEERRAAAADTKIAVVEGSGGVADIGAIVSTQAEAQTTLPHFLAETLVVVLPAHKIHANIHHLFSLSNKDEHRDMVFITGPSRTADIEQVLVLGAHGPKRLVVLLHSPSPG